MSVQISIVIPTPFMTVEQYAQMTGENVDTLHNKCRRGEIPIRKKKNPDGKASRETTLINMVALTLEGAAAYKGNITINTKGE